MAFSFYNGLFTKTYGLEKYFCIYRYVCIVVCKKLLKKCSHEFCTVCCLLPVTMAVTAKSWNKYWKWSSKLLLEMNLQDSLFLFLCIYEIQDLKKMLLKKYLSPSVQRFLCTSSKVTISLHSHKKFFFFAGLLIHWITTFKG